MLIFHQMRNMCTILDDFTHIDPTDRKAWRTAIKEMNRPNSTEWENGLETLMMSMMIA